MTLETFLTAVISSGVTGLLLAYLSRTLLEQLLSRDLERFKSDLKAEADRDLERHKTELRRAAYEREVAFADTFRRKSEALIELYGKLASAETHLRVGVLQDRGGVADARTAIQELAVAVEMRRVLLPAAAADQLSAISLSLAAVIPDLHRLRQKDTVTWDAVYDLVMSTMPAARSALELVIRQELSQDSNYLARVMNEDR